MCIRTELPNRPVTFLEGVINQIFNNTKQYSVQILRDVQETKTVKRGQIRLLRPPWWDELNDLTLARSTTPTPNNCNKLQQQPHHMGTAISDNTIRGIVINQTKKNHNEPIKIYSSNVISNRSENINSKPIPNRVTYIHAGAPLQLHHVLPTLQVNKNDFYI